MKNTWTWDSFFLFAGIVTVSVAAFLSMVAGCNAVQHANSNRDNNQTKLKVACAQQHGNWANGACVFLKGN